jgi:hypothetical protein
MKASRSSLATVSKTFDMAQRMATGRYDAGSLLDFPPPLYTGWIKSVLKPSGTMPVANNLFTRWLLGPAKTSEPILRMETRIPSLPSAAVVLSPLITFAILPALAKEKEKVDFS